MAKQKHTGKVVATQGNGIHISTGSANGGPTLADWVKAQGGEVGTTLENSAKPPSIKAPTPHFPWITVGICILMIAIVISVVLS